MYQMTLFIKKVIYKKYNLKNFFLCEYASKRAKSLIKGMASLACVYVQRISLAHANLHFRKKIMTPYQILYTLLAYMYKLIKDIKYEFQNSHTILMLLCVNNCL